ncbi:hypothetical protein U8335_01280 [Roseiconus lacunae]|uniref:hypothetical protein n=1 Tax=Roseiconus lacunae TaxID=2605694 RepID=UPI001E46A6E6|nr:hypothetical protein [Roseiconus lacunae]MCD0461476.1 hypothetical protein [Roseiconus lacunae]WRQ51180.1 hypothetical protein U8335_01280 [Stieleria sp. HD01]
MKIVFPLVCLTALIVAPGCSKMVEKATESAIESELSKDGKNSNVDISDGGMNIQIEGADGAMQYAVGESASIPTDFPQDIPVEQSIKINMAHSNQGDGSFVIQGTSPKGFEEVVQFYQSSTVKAGWKEETVTRQGGKMWMTSMSKDERLLNIIIAAGDDGTSITQNTGKK